MQFYKKNATRRQQYIKSDSSLACKIRKRKKRCLKKRHLQLRKASIGIEPMHSGFADQSLTTWV